MKHFAIGLMKVAFLPVTVPIAMIIILALTIHDFGGGNANWDKWMKSWGRFL